MQEEKSLINMEGGELTVLTEELKSMAELANEYAKRSMSKSTIHAYSSDWRDFRYWCESKSLPFIPADPSTVSAYLADRATHSFVDQKGKKREPLKVSTLERRITTIAKVHDNQGVQFNRKHPIIQGTWKGIKNTHGIAQNRKDPILVNELREMIERIPITKECKPYLNGMRDRALLLIGFSGAFRRSELVAIRMEDLKFTREGILINLRRSKTDQKGEGRVIGIPYGSNPVTCPVRTLQDWIEEAGIKEGALFRSISKHGHMSEKGISHHSVAVMIKNNPFLEGRSASFSGHSLRSGFATSAALAGVPEHQIMRQTGHKKSDTIKKYIRIISVWTENAAAKIGL